MGNRNDHLRWGYSAAMWIFLIVIVLILYIPTVLTIFHFANKAWLLFVGFVMYEIGVFLPDIDHHNTTGGKFLKRLKIKYRHRGNLHSLIAIIVYGVVCGLITLGVGFITGVQLTAWIIINALMGGLGYANHLFCDQWFDKNKKTPDANRPLKVWYVKKKK